MASLKAKHSFKQRAKVRVGEKAGFEPRTLGKQVLFFDHCASPAGMPRWGGERERGSCEGCGGEAVLGGVGIWRPTAS